MIQPIKIKFKRIVAPGVPPQTTEGMLVGQYLVVSFAGANASSGYALYNTQGHKLFKAVYVHYDDALKVAQFLCETYDEFFPIWEAYADADVFGWARWSVKDGCRIYESLIG